MVKSPRYRIYSDESGSDADSLFNSVAGITIDLEKIDHEKIEKKWKESIQKWWPPNKKGEREMKFTSISSRDKVNLVMEILNDINTEGGGGLCIDVLTWSKQDKIGLPTTKSYNAKKSLSIMYGFLFRDIIYKNAGKMEHEWYGDNIEHIREHWETTQKVLASDLQKSFRELDKDRWVKGYRVKGHWVEGYWVKERLLKDREWKRTLNWKECLERIKENFPVAKLNSKDYIFIQLADILAGFVRHTFDKGKSYASFKAEERDDSDCHGKIEHQNLLCRKIEEWLKKRNIEVVRHVPDGGLVTKSWKKWDAVNLWRFETKKKEEKEEKEEEQTVEQGKLFLVEKTPNPEKDPKPEKDPQDIPPSKQISFPDKDPSRKELSIS